MIGFFIDLPRQFCIVPEIIYLIRVTSNVMCLEHICLVLVAKSSVKLSVRYRIADSIRVVAKDALRADRAENPKQTAEYTATWSEWPSVIQGLDYLAAEALKVMIIVITLFQFGR